MEHRDNATRHEYILVNFPFSLHEHVRLEQIQFLKKLKPSNNKITEDLFENGARYQMM